MELWLLLGMAGGLNFKDVRRIYDAHTLWLPLLLGASGLAFGRRGWSGARLLLAAAGAMVGLRIWCTHVEPAMLLVRHVRVDSGKLARPIRLLHLSDMQPARVGAHEARTIAKARALEPDLVLYTGDLIQTSRAAAPEELRKMAALLATLKPRLGKLAIPGDTDAILHGMGPGELGGMELLESEEAVVDVDGRRLRILGLDLRESRGNPVRHVADWLKAGHPSDLTIVMGHAPDYALGLERVAVDLCLAGHTHGGQLVLPFFGAPHIGSIVPRSWARGLHNYGATRIHVSAGSGAERAAGMPPLRLNCPSEMTLIDLS